MDVEIFNLRLSKEIVEWLDYLISKGVYKSRSEAIRDFCRDYLDEKGDSNE
jgi:Arc/MetJ-type ribon-helix-helix transcriptional regulator